ncbi:hypothetical protein FXB39_03490 [Nocardioides sp. BGMRC 2183]|nr:hypothetical protein FXB39_03490 [Nocardioides sp. BGMRC 2183]
MLTVQVAPPPAHAPPQLTKREPAAATWERVTVLLRSNCPAQVEPQEIPDGLLLIRPAPVPALVTVRMGSATARMITRAVDP